MLKVLRKVLDNFTGEHKIEVPSFRNGLPCMSFKTTGTHLALVPSRGDTANAKKMTS